jgi:hypothetical protein
MDFPATELREWEYMSLKEYTAVNMLELDYLTLTSRDMGELTRLFLALTDARRWATRAYTSDPRERAWSCEGMTLQKMPRQPKSAGAMLQVPGRLAIRAANMRDAQSDTTRVSRFDLQVTVPIEDVAPMADLYSILSKPDEYPWQQPGKPPRVTMLQNSDGGETIYIGARTSDLMQRIYIKHLDGRHYVRYEIEVKGRLARHLDEQGVLTDKDTQATLARSVLAGLPQEARQLTMAFSRDIEGGDGTLVRSGFKASEDATLEWYATTVIPSLKRAMQGKLRDEVVALFRAEGITLAPGVAASLGPQIDMTERRRYNEAGNKL